MRVWPKGLLSRAVLLLLVPFFLLQILLILVFWLGHWQPLTNRLTGAVVNELDLLITAFENQEFNLVVQEGRQDQRIYSSTGCPAKFRHSRRIRARAR